jgi:hypothetical protein
VVKTPGVSQLLSLRRMLSFTVEEGDFLNFFSYADESRQMQFLAGWATMKSRGGRVQAILLAGGLWMRCSSRNIR